MLTVVPDGKLATLFVVDPAYPRAAQASVAVVGAFYLNLPRTVQVTDAWAPGYLPIDVSLSDGRCFVFSANYTGGALSRAALHRTACDTTRPTALERGSASRPPGRVMQLVGQSWGHAAWRDPHGRGSIITAPDAPKTFQPLYTTRMDIHAIMAMAGPDWPGGNITLVGTIDGRSAIVTLAVTY